MKTFLLPALLVVAIVLAWLLIRNRGGATRVAMAAATLGALSLILTRAGVSPLLTGAGVPDGPEGHWLRSVSILWWVIAARVAAAGGRLVLERDALSREARITGDLLSGVIYFTTLLVILEFVLLLPIGGLVATSGVVAVVIGFAMQNTLADVFSGIAVGIERPFGAGDRITLADGIEGLVIEINWRSIRLQTDGEDIVTIPNSVIAKAQILNRSVPTKHRSVRVILTCSSEVRPELVLELGRRATMLCPKILSVPAPTANIVRLGVRTNAFTIDYFVADTALIAQSRTMLLSQIHRQLRFSGVLPTAGIRSRSEQAEGLAIVEELPIFAGLAVDRLRALAGRLHRRPIRKGDLVFAKGADADQLLLVAAGVIDVFGSTAEVTSDILRRAGPGEAIGDIGLVAGTARRYTACAASDGLLYALCRDDLLELMKEDDRLAAELERSASDHIALLQQPESDDGPQIEHLPNLLQALRDRLRGVSGHREPAGSESVGSQPNNRHLMTMPQCTVTR